jgi:hypothetical protein
VVDPQGDIVKVMTRHLAYAGTVLGLCTLLLPTTTAHAARTASPETFNVVSYGADPTGTKDSTMAAQNAINAAQAAGPGNIVYFPTGDYLFHNGSPGGNALTVAGPNDVVLQGDGPSASDLIEDTSGQNLISIATDGTVVNQLELDTQTHDERSALVVAANNTLLENATILGGTNTFALFYPGPTQANKHQPTYNTGNQVDGLTITDGWTRDGFSFSYQENAVIENVTHTGSRLALFVDQNVEVDNYLYTPGTQTGGTQGFWITAPSNGITIDNFTTNGNGGTIGAGFGLSTNIAINNEVFNNPGFHLSIGDVDGLTINGCNMGSNNDLHFITQQQATNVVVENCTSLPAIRFDEPTAYTGYVEADFNNDTFPAFSPGSGEGPQTFINLTGVAADFTVNSGTFQNCAGGLMKGKGTTFAVNGLTGYPCSPDSPPVPALTVTPSSGSPNMTITADASGSTDTDKTPIADYQFTWGDGTATARQPSPTATHVYGIPGTFTVTVDVIDTAGLNATTSQSVALAWPNLVSNPGFETGTSGWAVNVGSNLVQSTNAHSGSYSGQLSRTSRRAPAILDDSPPSNTNTTAGTSCYLSAWVQGPAGLKIYFRTSELQGTTVVSGHSAHVVGETGTWEQISLVAPIVNSGDSLQMRISGLLAVGQSIYVDDVSEYCY